MAAIFHPTDLSAASAVAFRHALRLSLGGSLSIVHVHDLGGGGAQWSEFPQVRDTLARWGMSELLPQVRKIEATARDVEHALAGALKRDDADMIVLACHPRTGIAAWLKPSVSEAFVRHARLPALFVPEGTEGFIDNNGAVDLSTVMVAVAAEPDPQAGVDAATAMLGALGAKADLFLAVHAGEAPVSPAPAMPFVAGMETRIVTHAGEPAEVIVETAEREGARLIVMTTAGHDGFLDALRGSTTEQVIRRARCPVLAVPAPSYDAAAPG